jgi:hypothetical protein
LYSTLRSAEVEASVSFHSKHCDASSQVNAETARRVHGFMDRIRFEFLPQTPDAPPSRNCRGITALPRDS